MLSDVVFLTGIAAVASFLLTPLVCQAAIRLDLFDHPGVRKIHVKPVPRLGGVGVFASALVAVLAVPGLQTWGVIDVPVASGFLVPLLLGCTVLFLVGLWDDLWQLSVGVKLLGQAIASLIPILWGIGFDHVSIFGSRSVQLGYVALPLTFLWVIGVTNAFNLIDGLDGLSSGLAIIAAGTFALLFLLKGDVQSALVPLVLLGAVAGFLWHNFHPAKIFLGDSGSLIVGYTLAVTAVVGSRTDATSWPIAILLLVLGVPILDTLLAMTRRLIESLRIIRRDRTTSCLKRIRHFAGLLQADQRHMHYGLLTRGFSHRGAVLVLYGIATILAALACLIAILFD